MSYIRTPRAAPAAPADDMVLLSDVSALSGGYDFSIYWTSTERSAAAQRVVTYEAECNESTQRLIKMLHEHCGAGKLVAQYRVLIARLAADLRERDRQRAETAEEIRRLTETERAHVATIKEQEATITARGKTLDGLRAEVRQLEESVRQRDARIEGLLAELKRPRSPEPITPAGTRGADSETPRTPAREPAFGARATDSETHKSGTERAAFASASEQSHFASGPGRWRLGGSMESSFNKAWMRGGTSGLKDSGFVTNMRFQRQEHERRGEEQERVDVHRVVFSEGKQGEDLFSGFSSDPRGLWK